VDEESFEIICFGLIAILPILGAIIELIRRYSKKDINEQDSYKSTSHIGKFTIGITGLLSGIVSSTFGVLPIQYWIIPELSSILGSWVDIGEPVHFFVYCILCAPIGGGLGGLIAAFIGDKMLRYINPTASTLTQVIVVIISGFIGGLFVALAYIPDSY
jgi:hypothetical protein